MQKLNLQCNVIQIRLLSFFKFNNRDKIMKNPIVAKFIENGMMVLSGNTLDTSFALSEKIHAELSANNMKAVYHFDKENGTLIFDKVLGRDANNDFYNDQNGNLEERKEKLKKVIVMVLLAEYNRV